MNILITDTHASEYAKSIELETEKKAAYISFDNYGTVNVICKNAAHSVWRGSGRHFHGQDVWRQAIDAYKSAAMKSMILLAKQEIEAGDLF